MQSVIGMLKGKKLPSRAALSKVSTAGASSSAKRTHSKRTLHSVHSVEEPGTCAQQTFAADDDPPTREHASVHVATPLRRTADANRPLTLGLQPQTLGLEPHLLAMGDATIRKAAILDERPPTPVEHKSFEAQLTTTTEKSQSHSCSPSGRSSEHGKSASRATRQIPSSLAQSLTEPSKCSSTEASFQTYRVPRQQPADSDTEDTQLSHRDQNVVGVLGVPLLEPMETSRGSSKATGESVECSRCTSISTGSDLADEFVSLPPTPSDPADAAEVADPMDPMDATENPSSTSTRTASSSKSSSIGVTTSKSAPDLAGIALKGAGREHSSSSKKHPGKSRLAISHYLSELTVALELFTTVWAKMTGYPWYPAMVCIKMYYSI